MDRKTATIYRLMYLRLKSIEQYAKQSEAIQMRQFKRIMRVLRGTAYEQSLTSEPIRTYSDYQRIVPIVEYEGLRSSRVAVAGSPPPVAPREVVASTFPYLGCICRVATIREPKMRSGFT